MIEYVLVGAMVLVSAAYLLRKFVFKPKNRPSSPCGGCSGCGG